MPIILFNPLADNFNGKANAEKAVTEYFGESVETDFRDITKTDYYCEEGDRIREENPGKKIDYTSIAIKGLLFKFKPRGAEITVDGVTKKYKKVWLAPAMNGRCYGGGMYPTPDQKWLGDTRTLSTQVFHDSWKLKTLMIFSGIFKGEHKK